MPIYEYQCSACRHKLERIQKLSDEPLKLCPNCDKPDLVKLVSAAGFRLKGGGWYETDFKNKGKKNVVDSESSGSSSASGDSAPDSGGGNSADKSEKKSADKGSEGSTSAATPGT